MNISKLENLICKSINNKHKLVCNFGSCNKFLCHINPIVFIKLYKLFKKSPEYFYELETIGKLIKKQTIRCANIKLLFDKLGVSNNNDFYDIVSNFFIKPPLSDNWEYFMKKNKSIKLEKGVIDLLEKTTHASESKYIKKKFVCKIKDNWDLYFNIIILQEIQNSDKKWIFFNIETSMNLYNNANISQKTTEFIKLYNLILNYIQCEKGTSIKMEIRKGISNSVFTLEKKDLKRLKYANYSVTEKADGERFFIYIDEKIVYVFNPTNVLLNKKKIGNLTNSSLSGTLIDGEIVNNTFLGFDLLFYNNIDYRNYNLLKRLEMLNIVIKNKLLKSINLTFKIKKFYMDDIFNKSKYIWDNREKMFSYNLDGLIFTPLIGSYKSNLPIYKWKEKHSIDVRIYKNKGVYEFHSANMPVLKDKIINEYAPNIYFNRIRSNDPKYNKFMINRVLGSRNIKNLPKIEFLVDIIELEYHNGEWVFLRKRNDKDKANSYLSIMSVLNAIYDDITLNCLTDIKYKPSPYELNCKEEYGYDFSVIENDMTDVDHYMKFVYSNILERGKSILLIGADKTLVEVASNMFENVYLVENSCMEVYGTCLSEGYVGLKEFVINKSLKNVNVFYKNLPGNIKKYSYVFVYNIAMFFTNLKQDIKKIIGGNVLRGLFYDKTIIKKHLKDRECLVLRDKNFHPFYKLYLRDNEIEVKHHRNSFRSVCENMLAISDIKSLCDELNIKLGSCNSIKAYKSKYDKIKSLSESSKIIIDSIKYIV